MVFEKAKVVKAAEKFLSQGNIKAAIKEYRQIIQADNDDLTALNMLGDLLARSGEKDEAVSCFSRIAEHYRDQEFRLKAIAMYKKVERLKPRDPETAATLAELYAAQGLIIDARGQYLVVADAFTQAGDTKQTLLVLHKIADLEPHNTDVRLKLAEGYLKENMQAEAARAFAEAAGRLLENGEPEKSLNAYSRAHELRPHDKKVLKGLVSAHFAVGSAMDAAELLEQAVADNPEDTELLSMLADAYIESEDPSGAERATASLMALDSSNYRRYIEVARAYLQADDEDGAARVLAEIIETMLAGREENDLLELVNELLTRNPEHVASLRLLSRIHWWQRDMDKLRSALERLAESAEAAGLADDERYALTQLVRLAPDELHHQERLNLLGGSLEEVSEGVEFSDEASSAGVPSFETFGEIAGTEAIASEDAPDAMSTEFEWNSVAEETTPDTSASFADLNETIETFTGNESEIGIPGIDAQRPVIEGPEFNADIVGNTLTEPSDHQPAQTAPGTEAMMRQELESVDFYIKQGYSDIAIDTLELLERQFGSHPEIDSRRRQLNVSSPDAQPTPHFERGAELVDFESGPVTASDVDLAFAEVEVVPVSATEHVVPERVVTGIDSGLAEIFEEFRAEAEGEHGSLNEDYETHFNMATAYKEMDLLDEAIREFQTAANLTAPADGTARYFQCCNMLGHCFVLKGMPQAAVLWFKKGLEAPGRSAEEYKALQYELGSAYEQMGDLTRAIGVFTEVYGVDVGYRDVTDKLHNLQSLQATHKKKKRR
jgi:tetratricopeptide (TPR) repeat protein